MLLLTADDIARVIDLPSVIEGVGDAFAAHGRGETLAAGLTHTDADGGEFHVKTGGLASMFGAKVNGAFPPPAGVERPSIRGVIVLVDARDGTPSAILDSGAITAMRTGAATAVAARHLARAEASRALIIGAGTQARAQLRAVAAVLELERAMIWSRSGERAAACADELGAALGIEVRAVAAPGPADVIVTCTPSSVPVLDDAIVEPGTFVAGVGGDSPGKRELPGALLARARVVTDITAQCANVGELHHAIADGVMTVEDVYAELGRVVAGLTPGRTSQNEIFVFDSTGTAMQDVAAAVAVVERARAAGVGTTFDFR